MDKSEIVSGVNSVMHDGFEIPMEKLRPEATLYEELGLDSLDAIDLMVALEEKLGRKVNIERFKTVRTMGDIYTVIHELLDESTNNTETT